MTIISLLQYSDLSFLWLYRKKQREKYFWMLDKILFYNFCLLSILKNFQRWHLDMFGYELGKWTYWEKYCISVNSSWDNAGNNNNVMGHYWSHAKHRTSLLFKYFFYFGSFALRVSTKKNTMIAPNKITVKPPFKDFQKVHKDLLEVNFEASRPVLLNT